MWALLLLHRGGCQPLCLLTEELDTNTQKLSQTEADLIIYAISKVYFLHFFMKTMISSECLFCPTNTETEFTVM